MIRRPATSDAAERVLQLIRMVDVVRKHPAVAHDFERVFKLNEVFHILGHCCCGKLFDNHLSRRYLRRIFNEV
ncbi:hypothetical protein SDC9_212526 [bioreactor metagenome]|uniref:Uncharacterized protein n=1 Tax=bioreactor metagenome TaxID=1076179 RepID=A0A645JPT6_9ZZZZ